jgi:hypothetical protein
MNLWNDLLREFDLSDRAALELLAQAGACLDRAESLAEEIRSDGPVIRTRTGVRSHPSIKDEVACRTAVVRILGKLGVLEEPLRPGPGRPPE